MSWADVRAGWTDALRTRRDPRRWGAMTIRDAWRCGWWDYRAGFIAARMVTR